MKVRYYEKTPGNWWLDFRIGTVRHRVPGGASKAEAEAVAPARIAERVGRTNGAATSTAAAKAGVTLRQAFERASRNREQWIRSKDKAGLERVYATLGLPDDTDMGTLTRDRVRRLRADWVAEDGLRPGTKLAPSTINHRLSMLSVLLEAVDLPPHGVKHLSVRGNRRVRRVTDQEVNAMRVWLMASDLKGGQDMARLITAGLETGARRGELLTLQAKDIQGGIATLRDTKNGETRVIPLTEAAQKALAGGFAITEDRCSALWAQARAAIGLDEDEDFVFHLLRHEFASRMADKGVDGFTLMALMGHSNISTTQVYVKSSVGAMQRALGM